MPIKVLEHVALNLTWLKMPTMPTTDAKHRGAQQAWRIAALQPTQSNEPQIVTISLGLGER